MTAYEISGHETEPGEFLFVLAPKGKPGFLEKMKYKKGGGERYRLIVRTASKIDRLGACRFHGTLVRPLDNGLSLVEVKVPGKVIRVMACTHAIGYRERLILLFDFDGHQGSGQIAPEMMRRAKKLAAIARSCAEE
ncbi:hypothetical protein [Olsenella uli]|uniref:hypothetical protein n=1 Tax=Olsenella uli TaxID=133926 RepID=UPI00241C43BA|nr:hypothetical protein [Olsenella uli]